MTWPSTLRARLTLWYTALLGIPLIALALGFYALFARTLQSRTDRFIGDALTAFSRELGAERRATLSGPAAIHTTLNEVRFQDLRVAIFDSSKMLVAISPRADAADDEAETDADPIARVVTSAVHNVDMSQNQAFRISSHGTDYLVHARPLTLDGASYVLAGAYSLGDIEDVLRRTETILVIVLPLLLVGAATGGYFLATRSLVPVSAMAARAREITAANLQERVPVAGGEELSGLAHVVNDLLDRLEASFAQQRRFMADASHELRTPTAILRAEADVTLSRDHRTEGEYRTSLAIIRDSAQRLTRIVEDLFLLARADAGVLVERREAVQLEDIVHDAARDVRTLAERRGIRITMERVMEAPFQGDAALLGRVVLNLLDNAIKHSPDGGCIDASLSERRGIYEIAVVDNGEGIPPDAQSRIFERFYRADVARSRGGQSATSGAGLGLAISLRIAELHGGRLELVESRPGRTEFRVSLPVPVAKAPPIHSSV